MLKAVPMTLRRANEIVAEWHRHNRPVRGAKFALGVACDDTLWGVAIAGRPVARHADDGVTLEVTRCCVLPDAPKGSCSFLYGACWRVWRAMGGLKIITYTLNPANQARHGETGASLRGAGWVPVPVPGSDPALWASRAGRLVQTITAEPKIRWEAHAPLGRNVDGGSH